MEFAQPPTETAPAHEADVPTAPAIAEPEEILQGDQTPQAQEEPQPESQQDQETPTQQPVEQPAPVMVNIEGPASEHRSSRAAINNGYNSDSKAHYHSRSTDINPSAPEYAAHDTDQTDQSRQNSSPSLSHHPLPVPNSRPGSGLSSGAERPGPSQQQQQELGQRQAAQNNKNSVVIKVGMVGDAQIGKTSLMVKYVEGSWDEDYIQTLGKLNRYYARQSHWFQLTMICRCQLYGEDNLNSQH